MEETADNTGANKALHNDLVLKTLFDYLDAKDLQSCRLVCSKWEQISRSYFVKRSKVFIKGRDYSDVLKSFTETFSGASFMPFTKFFFRGFFPEYKFEDFLDSWPAITELFLDNISLARTGGNITIGYALKNSISSTLKTLSYNSSYHPLREYDYDTTGLDVRLDQMRSIKNLYLKGSCDLVLDYPICPDELSIQSGIGLVFEGEAIQGPILLNDFIDLKNVRKMEFNKLHGHGDVTVDVADCQRLEDLSHHWGTLVGLSPQSKIKELSISTPLDLSLLPVHLERLELTKDLNVSCTGEVNLPQLKYLYTSNGRFLSKFLNCPNLTDLIIGESYHCHSEFPNPLKVSRMFLIPSRPIRPNNAVHFDYLHFEMESYAWTFSVVLQFLEIAQTQTLVITFEPDNEPLLLCSRLRGTLKTSQASMASLIKIVDLQSGRGGIVALGGIEWDADCDSFLARVDRKSEFYLFTKGRGLGINEKEFEKLIQLKHDCMYLSRKRMPKIF